MSKRRFPWIATGMAVTMMLGPYRYWLGTDWGRWFLLFIGCYLGFGLTRWWLPEDSVASVLQRRLATGDLRLAEYRLLSKELGLQKKHEKKILSEQEIPVGNGR